MRKIRIPAKTFTKDVKPGPGKILKRVHRKAYLRKDTGAPGRTPKRARWFKKRAYKPIPDYNISDRTRTRRRAITAEVQRRGNTREAGLSVMRSLQAIVNINPSKNSDTIMKRDMLWMRKKYRI